MKAVFSLLFFVTLNSLVLAQVPTRQPSLAHESFVCNYTGTRAPTTLCNYLAFASSGHAEKVVDRILKPIGLVRNFKIMECANTQNCFATVVQGQRYIIYDGAFMQRIDAVTATDWSAISIMAHEIGHHLQGHTIDGKGGQPVKELEADKFSGFVLHQLGASLTESLAAIQALGSEYATSTHPAKGSRIDAIRKGWLEAEEIYPRAKPVGSPPISQQRPITPPTTASRNPDATVATTIPARPATVSANRVGCVSGNCQDGYGVFITPTREKYAGEFTDGDKHGQGAQFYPDGKLKYKGAFQEDERAGSGTYYYRNGDRYVGQFQGNNPHGRGIYYFSDGDRFAGIFRNGKRNGPGTLYSTDGSQETGRYEDDELIEEN